MKKYLIVYEDYPDSRIDNMVNSAMIVEAESFLAAIELALNDIPENDILLVSKWKN